MKKSLIALSVVAAFSAPAFADTSVYGTLDAAFASISNTGQKSQTLMVTNGLSASRLGVKASEDLGGGLTGIAQWEIALDSQNSGSIGASTDGSGNTGQARQKMLALSSASMGTIATGYLQTTGYDFGVKFDPTAESSISPLQNMTSAGNGFLIGSAAGAARAQRAIAYMSPNMSGFSVAVNYVTAAVGTGNLGVPSAAADSNITATLLSANYSAGPLAVGGVYASTSNQATCVSTGTCDQKEYALGGSYDLSVAKLFATYQSTKNDYSVAGANNNNKAYSLSGTIPVAGDTVALSYAHATIGTDTSGNSNGTSYTAGYLHSMSKTLTAYAAYSRVSNGSTGGFSVANNIVANTAASSSSNLVALGLSKKF